MIYLMLAVSGLVVVAFCAGLIVPLLGQSLLRPDSHNIFARFFSFTRSKAGYLVSFGAGALLVGGLQLASNPYLVSQWAGLYDDAALGSMIKHDEKIMQSGEIPLELREWYAARQ